MASLIKSPVSDAEKTDFLPLYPSDFCSLMQLKSLSPPSAELVSVAIHKSAGEFLCISSCSVRRTQAAWQPGPHTACKHPLRPQHHGTVPSGRAGARRCHRWGHRVCFTLKNRLGALIPEQLCTYKETESGPKKQLPHVPRGPSAARLQPHSAAPRRVP